KTQYAPHLHLAVEPSLLWEIADAIGDSGIVEGSTKDPDRALVGRDDVQDHPDGGGLSRAVGAEETVNRSLRNAQRQIVNGDVFGVSLRDVLDLDGVISHVVASFLAPYNIDVKPRLRFDR